MIIWRKILLTPFLILIACAIAGLYGALHNQISYTVSPDYFHGFKFDQFGFDPEWRNQMGASRIGFLASWWMGLMIGLPIALIGLIAPAPADYIRGFLISALVVVGVALAFGLWPWCFGLWICNAQSGKLTRLGPELGEHK